MDTQLIDRLINGLALANGLWAEKEALLRPGELACRTGCFGCCIGLFTIALPEAIALRRAVAGLPAGARAEILARASRAVERSAATFPGDPRAGVLDPARSDEQEAAWLETVRGTACPALDLPSGRCAVYSARPTTCRTYGLALARESEVLLPACELNLPSASPARVRETAIDAARLAAVDQALAEIAYGSGLPAGAETSVAHALVGTAFTTFEREGR